MSPPTLMSPFEQVAALYTPESPRTLEQDVMLHSCCGVVSSMRDHFLLARPVDATAPQELIRDPSFVFDSRRVNCWYVYAFAGPPLRAFDCAPEPLPWICWERRKGPLRFYGWGDFRERLERRLTGGCPPA